MQEVDIWQSLTENAQSSIMTISKDTGNGKWKGMREHDFCQVLSSLFCNADYQSQKILVISWIYCYISRPGLLLVYL